VKKFRKRLKFVTVINDYRHERHVFGLAVYIFNCCSTRLEKIRQKCQNFAGDDLNWCLPHS